MKELFQSKKVPGKLEQRLLEACLVLLKPCLVLQEYSSGAGTTLVRDGREHHCAPQHFCAALIYHLCSAGRALPPPAVSTHVIQAISLVWLALLTEFGIGSLLQQLKGQL